MSINRHDDIGGVWDESGNPRPESWNRNSIDPMPGFEEPFTPPPMVIDGDDLTWETSTIPTDWTPEVYPWTFDEGRLRWWDVGCLIVFFAALVFVLYIVINLYLRYARGA